jgi:hypothetical protein
VDISDVLEAVGLLCLIAAAFLIFWLLFSILAGVAAGLVVLGAALLFSSYVRSPRGR